MKVRRKLDLSLRLQNGRSRHKKCRTTIRNATVDAKKSDKEGKHVLQVFAKTYILMFQLQIVLFDLVKIYEDEIWMRRSKFGKTDCFDSGSQFYEKKLSLNTTKLVL